MPAACAPTHACELLVPPSSGRPVLRPSGQPLSPPHPLCYLAVCSTSWLLLQLTTSRTRSLAALLEATTQPLAPECSPLWVPFSARSSLSASAAGTAALQLYLKHATCTLTPKWLSAPCTLPSPGPPLSRSSSNRCLAALLEAHCVPLTPEWLSTLGSLFSTPLVAASTAVPTAACSSASSMLHAP